VAGSIGETPGVLYAEDFAVGDRYDLDSWTVTVEEIKAFAGNWDPLPFHLDDEAAASSNFGGLIASGLHTMAIGTRLVVDRLTSRTAVFAGREIRSARMHKPVRPGAVLSGSVEILEHRLRDDGRAVVVWRLELTDQDSDVVLTYVTDLLVSPRP
jgi:acyl dehydratase